MPSDDTNVNPYESPTTGGVPDVAPAGEASQPGRRFRWRLIPVTLAWIYGACALAGGIMQFGFWALCLLTGHEILPIGGLSHLWLLLDSALAMAAGLIWIVAGKAWLNRQWWRASIASVLGVMPYLASTYLKVRYIPFV